MRALALFIFSFFAAGAQAEEPVSTAGLDIELNATSQTEAGCQLSFLLTNGHQADINTAVFEAVLFDTAGSVTLMTLFDMGKLPATRPRVRQFVLPGMACEGLGQLLFNGAQRCESEALAPDACTEGLTLHSRTAIKVSG